MVAPDGGVNGGGGGKWAGGGLLFVEGMWAGGGCKGKVFHSFLVVESDTDL